MHPIIQRQFNPRRAGRHGRIVISGGYTWPYYYYGWPYGYGWPGYQQPVQERIVCERIAGSQECPDGTVVQRNADGTKTCCPPQATQATATVAGAYPPYYYGVRYARPWWGRRWW